MKRGDVLPEEAIRLIMADGAARTGEAIVARLAPMLAVSGDEARVILWEQVDAGQLRYANGYFLLAVTL